MNKNTLLRLQALAQRYETASFIDGDPSWVMHQVEGVQNQELMAFIASCLSYGNRKQFMPKIKFFIDQSSGNLVEWIASKTYQAVLPDVPASYYRLQSHHHMRELLNALHGMLMQHGSMGAYMRTQASTAPQAIEAITTFFKNWDVGHSVPQNTQSSCKRVCMFLRWMVRDNSPVDLGLWTFIDKRTLLIPLDTHVMQEAQKLKLIDSKTPIMSTAIKLTQELKKVFPDDPLKGDFALFGYAVDDTQQG